VLKIASTTAEALSGIQQQWQFAEVDEESMHPATSPRKQAMNVFRCTSVSLRNAR